jgi:hypothetical protein
LLATVQKYSLTSSTWTTAWKVLHPYKQQVLFTFLDMGWMVASIP